MEYILFRLDPAPATEAGHIAWFDYLHGRRPTFLVEGDEWKKPRPPAVPSAAAAGAGAGPADPANDQLVFVARVSEPREIARLVREDPLARYVLFRGDVVPVQVAIPVFIEGKSLDSLTDEWTDDGS